MRKRKTLSRIKLSDSQREKLKEEIAAFYLDERGEEIGMIEQIGRASCRERVSA